jgi:hypothetical protein
LNTVPRRVSSMSATAPDPPVDLTSTEDDPADSAATSKGHRGLDDIWDHYKKIKLEKGEASRLHRNYDARCKGCNTQVPGKPEKLRRHLATCNKAAPHSQIHALQEQAKRAGSAASQTASQTDQGPIDTRVDRVKVTPQQKNKWWYLLAVAFVMTGWSFQTVENQHFKDFMVHVRPNFELPSKLLLLFLAFVPVDMSMQLISVSF